MPYLPDLNEGSVSRAVVDVFGGYNHNLRIPEGEWFDESNLTAAHYPLFSQRQQRAVYHETDKPLQGVLAKDALAYVEDGVLYYNRYPVEGITLTEGDKQMVSMGAYLCIFPDGVYVNTANLADHGSMGAEYRSPDGATVTFAPCRADGEEYAEGELIPSDVEPDNPTNGQFWLDTSTDVHTVKQYSSANSMWVQVPTVYTKISCTGIGSVFAQHDGVEISGVQYDGEYMELQSQLDALNSSAIIQARNNDSIIVIGLLDQRYEQTSGTVVVERKVPKMDYVCEHNNRLWGCCYGMVDGKVVNEVYACKLGDMKNWNCFMGVSTDSYAASVGSDGEFTGCIAYGGMVLFFKENCIHKLSGSMPSNFGITTTACRGVQRGSHRSLVIVNEILYYKSRSDVCAYDGSLPVGVSSQLGAELYYHAAAGAHGGKYYVSMQDAKGEWHLFVYDTQRNVWHHEDNTRASGFTAWGDELFFIDAQCSRIIAENGTEGEREGIVRWHAESGLIGYELVDRQYVSRFNFRMRLGKGARCALAIEYDSNGKWVDQGVIFGHGTDSFVIPVIPQRCDHFRFRLEGEGDVKIYSIAKMIEQGSDA